MNFFRPPRPFPRWPRSTEYLSSHAGPVRLRPLQKKDGNSWKELRIEDRHILEKVEPTVAIPWEQAHSRMQWRSLWRYVRTEAARGHVLPFAIEVNGEFMGQMTISSIEDGTTSTGTVGYWVSSRVHNKGVATVALTLAVQYCFEERKLHRLIATVLPENPFSRKVLDRVGFICEGMTRRSLHINGEWRDHYLMAVTREDWCGVSSLS